MNYNQTLAMGDPLENLLPSLVQCFSVIFIGYLAVRFSLITSQAKALGTYVTKFALPALFFRSMATINLNDVNWLFILAVSLGKLLFFVITIIFTCLITRPVNLGMAGILSMFITQSNDVALGYPILMSLYPNLANYIYLFAPTQLVFINPLCFVLLEWHEYRAASNTDITTHTPISRRILLVLKNVLLNPLVYMTVIGVIFNFIFSHQLPVIIDKTLEILAVSFSGVALFYLGMNMVDKLNSITKNGVYILAIILLGKLIFLPFLTRELVVHLIGLQLPKNETLNYSLMGFFYGGLPTAPPVFLIANDFQVIPDVIATGLVVGTFLSGPLMFITGRMLTMVIASKYQYAHILQSTALSVSSLSIFGCIWVLVLFLLSPRLRTPLHRVTICYAICILFSCLGLIIGRIFLPNAIANRNSVPGWGSYVQFAIFFIGCTGTRMWTCFIALSLAMIKSKGSDFLKRKIKYFYLTGFCVPVLITSTILIFANKDRVYDIDPSFQFGRPQLICSLVILTLSLMATITLLILQVRFGNYEQKESPSATRKLISMDSDSCNHNDDCNDILNNNDGISKRNSSDPHSNSIKRDFINDEDAEELGSRSFKNYIEECQIHRHVALTIILVVTMGFGFFLCLWRVINEEISGIYIELEFLDCVFNFGQGFILWAIFGFDTQLIVVPFEKRIRWLRQNIDKLYIPREAHLSPEVCQTRDTFRTYHLERCRNDINRNLRRPFLLRRNVFTGKQIIDWILNVGLADDRLKAHAYGQALLISRVIENVDGTRNLKDNDTYLYRFVVPKSPTDCESVNEKKEEITNGDSQNYH